MIKIPLFIHINSSGGRYIRNKLCEKYNDNFIVHHINPRLYLDKYGFILTSSSSSLLRLPNSSLLYWSDHLFFQITKPESAPSSEKANLSSALTQITPALNSSTAQVVKGSSQPPAQPNTSPITSWKEQPQIVSQIQRIS